MTSSTPCTSSAPAGSGYRTILAAVTDGPPPTAYQRHLAHRMNAGDLDVTLHTTFSRHPRPVRPPRPGQRCRPFPRRAVRPHSPRGIRRRDITRHRHDRGRARRDRHRTTHRPHRQPGGSPIARRRHRPGTPRRSRRTRPYARRRTPHRDPPQLRRQRAGLPSQARPTGDQQLSVRITRRSRRTNWQPPLPPGHARRRPGLRDRRLTQPRTPGAASSDVISRR